VKGLNWQPSGTEWADYYDITNYSKDSFEKKKTLVAEYIELAAPKMIWDVGANNGEFSRVGSGKGIFTVSSDIDPSAVEKNYLDCKSLNEKNILPLVIDLTNPSPGIGWENQERDSFLNRGPVDLVMSLALIHHLAISNNLPLTLIAEFFQKIGNWLIIEFVPKQDTQVQRLLSSRKDIFPTYNEKNFEEVFQNRFKLVRKEVIEGTNRTLYLFRKK
jgi:hypothetical protein